MTEPTTPAGREIVAKMDKMLAGMSVQVVRLEPDRIPEVIDLAVLGHDTFADMAVDAERQAAEAALREAAERVRADPYLHVDGCPHHWDEPCRCSVAAVLSILAPDTQP